MPENTAKTIDEFNSQARAFTTKARAAGKSNTSMANTIRFMFDLFKQQKEQEQQWQIADIDGDGVAEWYNPYTQEVKPTGYGISEPERIELDQLADDGSVPTQDDTTTEAPPAIPETPSIQVGAFGQEDVTLPETPIDVMGELDKLDSGQNPALESLYKYKPPTPIDQSVQSDLQLNQNQQSPLLYLYDQPSINLQRR